MNTVASQTTPTTQKQSYYSVALIKGRHSFYGLQPLQYKPEDAMALAMSPEHAQRRGGEDRWVGTMFIDKDNLVVDNSGPVPVVRLKDSHHHFRLVRVAPIIFNLTEKAWVIGPAHTTDRHTKFSFIEA